MPSPRKCGTIIDSSTSMVRTQMKYFTGNICSVQWRGFNKHLSGSRARRSRFFIELFSCINFLPGKNCSVYSSILLATFIILTRASACRPVDENAPHTSLFNKVVVDEIGSQKVLAYIMEKDFQLLFQK